MARVANAGRGRRSAVEHPLVLGVGVCLKGIDAIGRLTQAPRIVSAGSQELPALLGMCGEVRLVVGRYGPTTGGETEGREPHEDQDAAHQRWSEFLTPMAAGGAP